MNQEEKYQQVNDDEIYLMDYLRVILKRKIFILVLFLLAVIAAGVFSFLSPKVYKIEALLEIGGFAKEPLVSSTTLAKEIEAGKYKNLIKDKLNITEAEYPKINIVIPENTNFLQMEAESVNPDQVKKVLEKNIELIIAEHQQKIEESKTITEDKIKEIQESLDLLKRQKIYADQGIASLQLNVSNLKEGLNFIKQTKIVKVPTVSENPMKPRLLINMVIAGILGLSIGIFLSLGREWWEKSK